MKADDTFQAISDNAKKLAKLYGRCSPRGKLGKTVSIIISRELKDCIALFLQVRSVAGVPSINPYVFGIPSLDERIRHLNACDLMRKFASQCDALNPVALRAITL